jgi:hypothetical protein
MGEEAGLPVSEIAPVNVERVRFRVVAQAYPGTFASAVYGRRHRLAMRAHRTAGAAGAAGQALGQRVGTTSPRTDLER